MLWVDLCKYIIISFKSFFILSLNRLFMNFFSWPSPQYLFHDNWTEREKYTYVFDYTNKHHISWWWLITILIGYIAYQFLHKSLFWFFSVIYYVFCIYILNWASTAEKNWHAHRKKVQTFICPSFFILNRVLVFVQISGVLFSFQFISPFSVSPPCRPPQS